MSFNTIWIQSCIWATSRSFVRKKHYGLVWVYYTLLSFINKFYNNVYVLETTSLRHFADVNRHLFVFRLYEVLYTKGGLFIQEVSWWPGNMLGYNSAHLNKVCIIRVTCVRKQVDFLLPAIIYLLNHFISKTGWPTTWKWCTMLNNTKRHLFKCQIFSKGRFINDAHNTISIKYFL